jgi:pyridoxal phosphate enzyme (YggS family)|tara:strand:- start:404 stop:1078 length:675 start_codon:yes stop_codon:yes gene_type:complete
MHRNVHNLIQIEKEIQSNIANLDVSTKLPKIIAVSKTHPMASILPLINHGHLDFGENKVQEAIDKWQDTKQQFDNLNLHMIGKLQTNKVKQAISLFDFIHSVDNFKLAEKIANEQIKQKKNIKLFIQVNIGEENQKNGIEISNLENFYKSCISDLNLDVVGLMCLPPIDQDVAPYFLKMKDIHTKLGLKELSMGMSNDYIKAIKFNSSYLRIGSKIFGQRNTPS